MAELLYSIEKVFGDYLGVEKKYNIPEYQRGYKWSKQQIHQLLDDVNEFETAGDDNLFYCLQNITLVPNQTDKNKINVVDGQQRLTTIALILSYLGEGSRVKDKIFYAVREPSNLFIQEVISNNNIRQSILDSLNFNQFLENHEERDYDYQDIYYMYTAFHAFDDWFKKSITVKKEIFLKKFLSQVKLIVNRIENVSEEQLFMNLNAGQVHLDGADLVRAILITRVAKQEMEEYDAEEIQDVIRINERRIRIGWELDEINAWWNQQQVKEYFKYFTKIKTGTEETIKFDQKIQPINLLYKIWAESEDHIDIKLRYFEPKNKNAMDLYISIVHLHRTMKDWFEDRKIYHLLGFLFSYNKSNKKNPTKMANIWDRWNKIETTRDTFIDSIKEDIKVTIFGKEEEEGLEFWLCKIIDYDDDEPTNWYEIEILEKVLLLIDIVEHAQKRKIGTPLPFLDPRYFINYKEDKEHIYPSTPKEISKSESSKFTVSDINKYINILNQDYQNEKLIHKLSENTWIDLDEGEKNNTLNNLKKEIHKKRPINSLGNLVLLHFSINRGFGNDYYADKRMSVINNTENGYYVRPHTLKVFVKQIESQDLNKWTMEDIKNNADHIHRKLENFFNITLNGEKE